MTKPYITFFHVSLLVLVVCLIYLPGLKGQFQFDDYPNIVNNTELHIQSLSLTDVIAATLSSDSGILKRPVSMLTFAVNHYFSALHPFAYKLTNLIIHIFNTLAIYSLTILLFKIHLTSKKIGLYAFLIALAWGCHPINLTSVLYVVQRMTSLSASFAIVGMIAYLISRNYLITGKTKTAISGLFITLLLGMASVFSKENGALLFIFLFLIEFILLQKHSLEKKEHQIIRLFFTLTLLLPAIFIIGHSIIQPEWITQGFGAATSFTLFERILTELRIVWLYIFWIIAPSNQTLGLFHDDIILSTTLFTPISTLLAGLGHIALISLLVYLWLKKKHTYFVFGCSLFYASHLIESTILPLQLAHEHRNYLGSYGLLFSFFSLCFGKNKFFLYTINLYTFFLCLITLQRSLNWADGLENALIEVEHHPNSYAANYEVGRQYGTLTDTTNKNFSSEALKYFHKASILNKAKADAIFAIVMVHSKNKETLPEHLLNELYQRLSTGPAYASYPVWLSTLIDCHIKEVCLISETQLSSIIQAAVSNPSINNIPTTGSMILLVASGYVLRSGNYDNALALALAANNLTPTHIIFIRHIINLALTFHDHNTAQQWIQEFENLPHSKIYTQEINSFKRQLTNLK